VLIVAALGAARGWHMEAIVHEHGRYTLPGDHHAHGAISGQPTDIVDKIGALRERGPGDLGFVRIHRKRQRRSGTDRTKGGHQTI